MAEEKMGIFQRLKEGLSKTHQGMVSKIDQLISGKRKIDDRLLEELEEILITSDIGVKTTRELLDKVTEKVKRKELEDADHLKKASRKRCSSSSGGRKSPWTPPWPGLLSSW